MRWTVVYDDPKRKRGASHSLHTDGCRDIVIAEARGGNPFTFDADDLAAALLIAQYQGLGEGGDLGDVEPAPCVRRG